MGIEQVNILASVAPTDSLTDVVAPMSGVKITVRESHHELYEFELVVYDLDTGLTFKTINSNNLADLLDRQHKLLLAFAV
jgi:hypothetical protein